MTRRFVKYFTIFTLPLLILAVAAEAYLRSIPNPYKIKDKWMTDNRDSVEIVILGTSRGYYGINPKYFKHCAFNLANVSQRPDYDLFLMEKYVIPCKNIKTVIIPTFYEQFIEHPFEETTEWPRATYYKLYMGCDFHSDFSRYAFELSSLSAAKVKVDEYWNGVESCDSLGFGMQYQLKYKDKEEWVRMGRVEKFVKANTISDTTYLQYNYNNIRKIAELANKNDIRLVFVEMPCLKTYRELVDSTQVAISKRLLKQIDDDYKVEFYNFYDDPRFEDDDFFDFVHLSDLGAKKMTAILSKIIE